MQWGATSPVYLNRVEGQFASGDADGLIPLAWVEEAIERWRAWDEVGRPLPGGRLVVGVDVARFGTDKTVLASRRGNYILEVERHAMSDTMQTVGRVIAKLQQPSDLAVVDVIGLGSGVVDRLREQKKAVRAFNAAAASPDHDRSHELGFANQRAAAWWRLRELLDPAGGAVIALPDDDELVGDLCSPHWKMTSAGKVQIESKDDIRKRIGRSPDVGDAVVMAFTERSYGALAQLAPAVPWNDRTDVPRRSGSVLAMALAARRRVVRRHRGAAAALGRERPAVTVLHQSHNRRFTQSFYGFCRGECAVTASKRPWDRQFTQSFAGVFGRIGYKGDSRDRADP